MFKFILGFIAAFTLITTHSLAAFGGGWLVDEGWKAQEKNKKDDNPITLP